MKCMIEVALKSSNYLWTYDKMYSYEYSYHYIQTHNPYKYTYYTNTRYIVEFINAFN